MNNTTQQPNSNGGSLVSVIVPNYNHAAFLRERIDSVLAQNYKLMELIILDDCSTDDSRNVIEQYRNDSRVTHIIYNKVNSGNTFLQWERGVELAKGDLIWIAESDDTAEPTFLSTLVEQLEKAPDAVLAYSYSQVIDQDGNVLYNDASLSQSDQRVKLHRGKDYLCRYMLRDNCIYNASMVVFRRAIFHQIDPSFKKHRFCGDWSFWAQACTLGNVVEVRVPLSRFRQHTNKVTVRSHRDASAWIDASTMIAELSDIIHLDEYHRSAMRIIWGRRMKRVQSSEQKQQIIDSCPSLYNRRWYDYPLYKYAKIYGFLKYRSHNVMNIFNVPNP